MEKRCKKLLFALGMIMSLLAVSLLGYLFGISNVAPPGDHKIDVTIETDSVMLEVIRSQTKIELEMLRIIGEQQTISPTIKNIIPLPKNCCQPQIVNSFNDIVVNDTLKK